ncbi:hypothetical protein D3C86_1526180 [compost metagenome]
MKPTKNKTEETKAKKLEMTDTQVCDQNSIIVQGLKYPLGYARPNERKAKLHFKQNLKRLPKSNSNIKRSQEEAYRNGLTEVILEKLLTEDAA